VAFAAATSIATIGLYISYAIPIFLGAIYHKDFKAMKGPFDLKGLSIPIAGVSCLWISFITIIFCLPTLNPVSRETLNYTPVAVGILGAGAIGSWVLWAHHWFTGPAAEVAEAIRLGVDITEPGALEQREKAEEARAVAESTAKEIPGQ